MVLDSDSSNDGSFPAAKYSQPTAKLSPLTDVYPSSFVPNPDGVLSAPLADLNTDLPAGSSLETTLLTTVYPFKKPATSIPAVSVGEFGYSNILIDVTPGQVNLPTLPLGKYLHGSINADGGCLFSALSYSLSESQSLSEAYRAFALKFISDHPDDFKDDIFTETKKSVEEYVEWMSHHFRFGDQIMLIALCLSFEVSITLYQKGRRSFIDVYTFAPRTGNTTHHAELYLDLYGYHYDCILSSPLAPEQVFDVVILLTNRSGWRPL